MPTNQHFENEKIADTKPHKCPICNGTGLVSRPPGVAGDQVTFSSTSTGPWACIACNQTGIIWG